MESGRCTGKPYDLGKEWDKNALKCSYGAWMFQKDAFEWDIFLGDTKVLFCKCRVIFVWCISWFCLTSVRRSFSFWLKRPSETFSEVHTYSCSKSYSSAFAEMGLKTTDGLVLRRENFPECLFGSVLHGYPTHLQQALSLMAYHFLSFVHSKRSVPSSKMFLWNSWQKTV